MASHSKKPKRGCTVLFHHRHRGSLRVCEGPRLHPRPTAIRAPYRPRIRSRRDASYARTMSWRTGASAMTRGDGNRDRWAGCRGRRRVTRGGGAAAVLWLVLVVLCQSLTQGAHNDDDLSAVHHRVPAAQLTAWRRCVIPFRPFRRTTS